MTSLKTYLPITLVSLLAFPTDAVAEDSSPAALPTVGLHLGAHVGLGQATVSDGAHFAIDIGLSLAAELWVSRHWGIGLRADGDEWDPLRADSGTNKLYHGVSAYEPQVLWRTSPLRLGRWIALGALVIAGVGAADVATYEHRADHHPKYLSHSWQACGSLRSGLTLDIAWFSASAALRGAWNSAGDWAVGPELNLGAVF